MDAAGTRTTLIVIFGGKSAEHDVSCVTAAHVTRAVDSDAFDTVVLAIDRDGRWHRPPVDDKSDALVADGPAASPDDIIRLAASGPVVVVPLVHGPHGEDGTLQGLCEVIGVPYVGSGVLASAMAMDKGVAKTVFESAGLPQARHVVARIDSIDDALLDSVTALGFPVFVKPANMGSSVGVSKAADLGALHEAIELAARYDEWIVVEEAIVGREVEVAVIGNHAPRASLPGEIRPGRELYDYADKYVTDGAALTIPADLPQELVHEVRTLAIRAYEALRCEGMARVDFFYEENGRGFLLNEINTIPGFTPISMYPKLWEASGLPYTQLITELVEHALERHQRRSRRATR